MMARGHRGANHPVKDLATGKVDITSQNHGFYPPPGRLTSALGGHYRSFMKKSIILGSLG
jgi:carbamoylphosphate synthase small subunit